MKVFLLFVLFTVIKTSTSAGDGYKRNPLIDIRNYTFSISISDTSDIIYGRSAITMNFMGEVKELIFDLKNINSSSKGMMVDSVLFSRGGIRWIHNGNKLIIATDSILKKGTTGVLKIVYHGIPSNGLIISNNKYKDRTFFSDNWPDRASNYLPCIDHPSDKATVEFIIIAPSHYEIVASGILIEESHLPGDVKLHHWKETVPLATKVMAFGAADFDFDLAGIADKIPVWTYVFRENRKEGFYDYAAGVKPVTFFSQLIGPYSYEKLANVQSKTIFGGLENAGCIFYSENSVTGNGKAEGLMVHEIAHQWFGNSVTEDDWFHIWLSEGFATYLTSVYMEKNYGKEKLDQEMKSDREQVIKYYLKSPGPVIDTTITNLMKLLNANSYQKGAWVLHMLRRDLGDETFWKGIRLYYERFRNGNSVTDDFIHVMEEVSGKDLEEYFYQWLYIAGQPDLKIKSQSTRRKGETEIIIEQKQKFLFRFPLDLLISSQEGEYRRHIQISDRISRLIIKTGKLIKIMPDPDVNLLFRQVD